MIFLLKSTSSSTAPICLGRYMHVNRCEAAYVRRVHSRLHAAERRLRTCSCALTSTHLQDDKSSDSFQWRLLLLVCAMRDSFGLSWSEKLLSLRRTLVRHTLRILVTVSCPLVAHHLVLTYSCGVSLNYGSIHSNFDLHQVTASAAMEVERP
jgi:hypothetical protein